MRGGMLKHIVMHKLAEKSMSGYAICKEIEKTIGRKPSYGSIYPILERLNEKGYVTVKKDGRRKIYTITSSGKKAVAVMNEQRGQLANNLISNIKGLFELTDQDPEPMIAVMQRMKRGEAPLGRISGSMIHLRDTVFRMSQDGRADRHTKEINKILSDTTKKLKKLK